MAHNLTDAYEAFWQGDTSRCLSILTELAESNDPEAQLELAARYKPGSIYDDIAPDQALHEYWMDRLLKTAQGGSSRAQTLVSQNNRFGNMVPFDFDAADFWLLEAAKNGDAEAQYEVHLHFLDGSFSFDQDEEKAQYWLHKAIEQKYPEALWFYSRQFWQDGKPTQKAINLWIEAARLGFHPAVECLKELKIPY